VGLLSYSKPMFELGRDSSSAPKSPLWGFAHNAEICDVRFRTRLTSVFGLGLLSAVFDNIALTALALNQGGYDWALLAYAVGFGGSIVWFGSSAGVALTNLFPEGRSVIQWLRQGWSIPVAYIVGFLVMLAVMGWRPQTL
jgi:Na+/H+ antiporter NhaD/arsenite permease-like protein